MRIFEAAFCAALLAASAANAADVTDPVPGHPGVTFETLLKQVMPDLAKDANGNWTSKTLPHLRGTDDKEEPDAELSFNDVQVIQVKEDGHARLLVLTGDSQTDSGFSAVLVAFDPSTPKPKLLDYMDVGGDRFVGLGSPPTLAIGPDTDAVIININHFNSNENYSQDTPIFLHGGRLNAAFTQFTLNEGFCGYEERQVPVYSVRDDKGAAFRAILVSVTQTVRHTDETCDEGTKIPKASKHTYTDVYRWDAKKGAYVSHTNAMGHLIQPDQ